MKKFFQFLLRAERSQPVDPEKFDRHIEKARRDDMEARRKIFVSQSEAEEQHDDLLLSFFTSAFTQQSTN